MKPFFDFFKKIKWPALKRPSAGQAVFWIISLLLIVGAFVLSQNIFACWNLTQLPGIPPSELCSGANVNPLGTPVVNEQGTEIAPAPTATSQAISNLPPSWDGASRVNILFIGLDYRDYLANEGAPRSDTMILFTIDPQTKTAGMLSIPRDLWVNIPGYGYSRINTAYSIGEGNKLPGGGPGLAMKTVEAFLGVPIQYYGQIDFHAFEEAIDAMGGLNICIPEKIRVDPIGKKPPVVLKPGCQTLPGYLVLAYARNRHTEGGDVDRARRQQLVIMALRDQIFSPKNFPTMITKAPDIYREASAGLRSNLSFDDAMRLAMLLSQIPLENIKRGVIDYTMVTMDKVTLNGQAADIFKPIPDKIRVLRDEIFTSGGPTSPLAQGDTLSLMQADGARVRLLNGSGVAGLEQRTGNFLLSQGMTVTEVGPADRGYSHTVVVIYSPKLYALRYIVETFGIASGSQIIFKPDATSTVDLEIRLGVDWVSKLPAGF